MRAACCEATVLRNRVIAPDIRLRPWCGRTATTPPHAGQFFPCALGRRRGPLPVPSHRVHRWNPDSSTIEFLYQVVGEGTSWHSSSSGIPSSLPAPWATALMCRTS